MAKRFCEARNRVFLLLPYIVGFVVALTSKALFNLSLYQVFGVFLMGVGVMEAVIEKDPFWQAWGLVLIATLGLLIYEFCVFCQR